MTFESAHLGAITVEDSSVIEFPTGLPGFEELRRFAILTRPDQPAVVFLQSSEEPAVCFVAVPVGVLWPGYTLAVNDEDLELLGIPPGCAPRIGEEVIALAVLSLVEGEGPTANLLSPVIVHMKTGRAVQAIRPDSRYSCREPLEGREAECS
jgi:flagellar assembly factor FliW